MRQYRIERAKDLRRYYFSHIEKANGLVDEGDYKKAMKEYRKADKCWRDYFTYDYESDPQKDKMCETNLPSVPVIITNEDPGSDLIDYEVFNHILRVHYITVTPEKISKRLNILNDIVETRREFTVDEVLNFAYIAIFVKRDAKEIMERTAILFSRFPKIDQDLKIDLHQVLKKMILYHFQDDLKKAEELLYLITMNFIDEDVDKMNSYEREIYAKNQEIIRKDQEITKNDKEISRLNKELDELKKNIKLCS